MDKKFDFGEVIYSYTADDAIEDGTLVKVDPKLSREAGFTIPVRITSGVHGLCEVPKGNRWETYKGRLWDVLNMAKWALKGAAMNGEHLVEFKVKIGRRVYRLWACLDTTSGRAIHIMMPEEY